MKPRKRKIKTILLKSELYKDDCRSNSDENVMVVLRTTKVEVRPKTAKVNVLIPGYQLSLNAFGKQIVDATTLFNRFAKDDSILANEAIHCTLKGAKMLVVHLSSYIDCLIYEFGNDQA